jgi:hypothetical protein
VDDIGAPEGVVFLFISQKVLLGLAINVIGSGSQPDPLILSLTLQPDPEILGLASQLDPTSQTQGNGIWLCRQTQGYWILLHNKTKIFKITLHIFFTFKIKIIIYPLHNTVQYDCNDANHVENHVEYVINSI